jgi:zinc protease
MLAESDTNPMMVGSRAAAQAPYPQDDPRFKPLTVEMVDRLTLESSQAWLEKLIKESPIEVVIVGDVPRERALELVSRYVGSLASRQRVGKELFASQRKLQRPPTPRLIEKQVKTPTSQAFVLSGFYGADESNRADARALGMAARILSTRMVREVREEAQLVYSIGASSRAAATYPGFGVFSASAPTDPGKADALVAKLASMYEAFAKAPPTDEEVSVARRQYANTYAEQVKEPSFWSGRLSQLDFRGIALDELAAEPEAYQALTAQQVHDAFAKYYSKDNSIVVVVKPDGQGPATTQPAAKPTARGD